MPAYGAPGAGASNAIESFLLQQQQQQHMQLMDRLAVQREKRLAEREMLETQWAREDREKKDIEKQIAGMQRGDVIPTELKTAAAKYHIPLPSGAGEPLAGQQFMQPGAQPDIATGDIAPGMYRGTPGQQYGVRLRQGEFKTPTEAVGAAMEANLPVPEQRVLESIYKPQAQKWLPGTLSGSQLPEGATDIYGAPITPKTNYRVSQDGKMIVPQTEKTQQIYWESPKTGNVYARQEDGSWKIQTGAVAKDAHWIKEPPPDAIKYLQTADQGYVTVPSKVGARGAPSIVTPSGVRPSSNVPIPATLSGMTTSKPAAAAGSRQAGARQVVGPDGQPLYGTQGPPLTEAGAAPFAVMLAAGISPTTLMSMGMAGSMRNRIANLAADYRTGKKAIPPELVGFVTKVADKATTIQTLKFLQKQQATAATSANIAKENLKLAVDAADKVARTDSMFINRFVNRALRETGIEVMGDTNVGQLSDFETKIYTAIREYAKVASGSSGSVAGLSEGATREATALLNSAQSPQAFKAATDAMIADMDNIIGGWQKSYQQKIDALDDTKPRRSAKDIVDSLIPKK